MKFPKLLAVAFVLALPFVSAYGVLDNIIQSPATLLQNDWVVFALVFGLFFAIIYVAIGKTIHSKGPAIVISAIVSIFIAVAILQRTWYYGYLGESLGSWFYAGAIIVIALFVLRVGSKMFGGIGMIILVFIAWYALSIVNLYDVLPYDVYNSSFRLILEFLASTTFLWILIFAAAALLLTSFGTGDAAKAVKGWLWGKKKEGIKIILPK